MIKTIPVDEPINWLVVSKMNSHPGVQLTSATQTKGFLIGCHGIDSTHQRRIKAVHRRDQIANRHDEIELEHILGQ